MKVVSIFFLLLFAMSSNVFAEYKSGWDYMNFYKAVETCRESIVFPQIKNYEKRGKEKQHDKLKLKDETISMTPVFDKLASDTCFCTYNEIAKDNTFKEYNKGVDIEGYMSIPRCKKVMEKTMASMKDTIKLKLK